MAEETKPKWEGKVMTKLKGATVEEFCRIDKLFPDMVACYRQEGSPRKSGKHTWFEELCGQLSVSLPMEADGKPAGCKIEWSFVADPVERWHLEDFVSYIDNGLQFISKKIGAYCRQGSKLDS